VIHLNDFGKITSNKLDVTYLRIVGCKCFFHIEPENREKLKNRYARAWLGILIEFIGRLIYKVYNPATGKIAKTPYVILLRRGWRRPGEHMEHALPEGANRRKNEGFDLSPVGEVCGTGKVVHRLS
jgi:hypothetical protein